MESLRRILVGIELDHRGAEPTAGSKRAMQQAAWLAQRNAGEVTLLHTTWDGRDEPALEASPAVRETLEALRAEVEGEGVAASVAFDVQRPWLAIAERAAEADLVCAGKRGAEAVEGGRFGPTAMKLVRACPAPIWLVEPNQDLSMRLVLAATDLSEVGQRSVEAAAWLAGVHGAELHVVHAWRIPRALQQSASDMDHDEYLAEVEMHRARAQAAFEQATLGLSVDPVLHLDRGPASTRILARAESLQPDLVVLGSLSTGGRAGVQVGETAERVLPRLEPSVLTFKPRAELARA